MQRSIEKYVYKGRIYPNGEFSVGWKRLSDVSGSSDSARETQLEGEIPGIQMPIVLGGVDYSDWSSTVNGLPAPKVQEGQEGGVSIGLSTLPNSHTRKRGLKGITSYGKKMVRNGAYLLEKRYGRKKLSFLTLTIPSVSRESWKAICGNWGEMVRVFMQWLNRRLEKNGLPTYTVSCTELQEERAVRTDEPALHLHALFVGCKTTGGWALSPLDVRSAWERTVRKWLTPADYHVSFASCERIESVRKSASGYLGKYMSKGVQAVSRVSSKNSEIELPHTWYNLNALLRNWVLSSVIVLNDEDGRWLATEESDITSALMSYRSLVKVPRGRHRGLPIALVGTLQRCTTTVFLTLMNPLMMETILLVRMVARPSFLMCLDSHVTITDNVIRNP